MEPSDVQLVQEIRGGSGVAFERLMGRYERLVFKVAYGFTGERESALDVTQNVFLKVHRRLSSWRSEGELKSWIARIAANEALNWKRREKRYGDAEVGEDRFIQPDPPQEGRIRDSERRELLRRSLAELNPRQRFAIVLRYFHGMSSREISEILQCSDGTVRNVLFRSLRKLRSVLSTKKEALL